MKNQERETVEFRELTPGDVCRVMIAGKYEYVTPLGGWFKSGSRAYNARKLTGRKGKTSIRDRREVEVISRQTENELRDLQNEHDAILMGTGRM